jgi:hypothetical protein
MRSFTFLLLLMYFGGIPVTAGDAVSFPEVDGWELKRSDRVYTPDNLWDLINGAAESYISYDFLDLHLADYEKPSGLVIHTEVYRHSSNRNAFGIYASERSPEYHFLDLCIQGYREEGILNFISGPCYVKLYSTGSGPEVQASLTQIAKALCRHLQQDNSWPELLMYFPEQGRLEHSEYFIRENFIGLDFLHHAFTVEYEGGYRLFLISAGTGNEILQMAMEYLDFTGQEIDPRIRDSFTIKDKYNGDIPVILKGRFMAGIIEGADDNTARKNLSELASVLPGE